MKFLKGCFAVTALAMMTVLAATMQETDGGLFQDLFAIAGKWPFVGVMALATACAAVAVGREFGKSFLKKTLNSKAAPPAGRGASADGYSADRIARVLGQAASVVPPQPIAKPTPPVTAADQQLMGRMLEGMVAQVQHEQRMVESRGTEPVSVRLVPQIPIRNIENATAWMGGGARLPVGMVWPKLNGEDLQLLAQIDCRTLPQGLWDGLGPRRGWLAIFLAPKSYAPLVHHFEDAGPLQPAPPILPDSNMVGLDMRPSTSSNRLLPVMAFPRWPVDVVSVLKGQNDPQREGQSNALHDQFRKRWDMTDPGYRPMDWAAMQMAVELSIEWMEKRAPKEEAPNMLPDKLAAAEERISQAESEGMDAEKIMDMRLRLDEYRAKMALQHHAFSHGPAMLEQLKRIKEAVDAGAAAELFSDAKIAPFLAALRGMTWIHAHVPPLYRDGKKLSSQERKQEGVQTFQLPLSTHDPDASGWVKLYGHYLLDRAKHIYSVDPGKLPAGLRAQCEQIWKGLAAHDMGAMGHVPWGYVHEFNMGEDLTLLELPSSGLMNWQFGDVYNLVLTIQKADLAQNRFDRVKVQVSN